MLYSPMWALHVLFSARWLLRHTRYLVYTDTRVMVLGATKLYLVVACRLLCEEILGSASKRSLISTYLALRANLSHVRQIMVYLAM